MNIDNFYSKYLWYTRLTWHTRQQTFQWCKVVHDDDVQNGPLPLAYFVKCTMRQWAILSDVSLCIFQGILEQHSPGLEGALQKFLPLCTRNSKEFSGLSGYEILVTTTFWHNSESLNLGYIYLINPQYEIKCYLGNNSPSRLGDINLVNLQHEKCYLIMPWVINVDRPYINISKPLLRLVKNHYSFWGPSIRSVQNLS